jgi:hypothetical protein
LAMPPPPPRQPSPGPHPHLQSHVQIQSPDSPARAAGLQHGHARSMSRAGAYTRPPVSST